MARYTLIAGPTASGKSALAMTLAQDRGGVIVNTDSMQVYGVLRLLTARPDEDDLASAPHRLFGHVDPREHYSTGRWLDDVRSAMAETGDTPVIFAGGTGLYFRALTEGISPMPEIDDAVRQRWRYRLHEEGAPGLHRLLRSRDPEVAELLKPGDGQRIVRALEVLEMSGKSILWWQQQKGTPVVDPDTASIERIVLEPDRDVLAERIERRFDVMLDGGAVDEVRLFRTLGVDPALPAAKAIGLREIGDWLDGKIDLAEARRLSITATRQYAKRQMTWFRNQFGPRWQRRPA